MMPYHWSWIGACSIGTSHLRAGVGCDDAGACVETHGPRGSVLIAVVSDGAGSAAHGSIGARIVVQNFCRRASAHFARPDGRTISDELVREWLDDIRDRIGDRAERVGASRRDFAATLVGCVVDSDGATIVHVGDGACVLRLAGVGVWEVPSWPTQGEYAATTFFVTDDPEPRITVRRVSGRIEEVALLTDGVERLALDFASSTAFAPFFESMFRALRKSSPGRQRRLSADLRAFLDGSAVTERTDDDKTLILARLAEGP